MKIAVTYENGQVFQHFGHSEQFKVYEVENNAVIGQEVVSAEGGGHGALSGLLSKLHVDTLICGGIGAGARNALAQAGIRLYRGASGGADEAVQSLLNGTLRYDSDAHCGHHHEEGHGCGHHCGEDKHGCSGS
ncbi:NifB/NifX family molybdenum-iron cluster-binding protein [Oscillibacter sp. MSJ-2]|uniref:NifB/NifX family molybdenum-iron cluster-binding protein n=1 Tax=Dysosmobacter acutus TaxID=2841504 RepID=A0ABS6FBR2_9FIRM|nr:NifB/NifX family molybdenum-iron cluster-binding protein [Dysosmobacter acutus]MBU5627500.1 NifB/NifX family molybdenum-iron cluster-binding protein [Dysosmobacter acutus]